MATTHRPFPRLIDGILRGGIRVVDLTVPLEAATPDHPPAAAVRAIEAVRAGGDLALRLARAGLVLEQHQLRRAYRHAFRCAHTLGHRQGLSRQRDAQYPRRALHRPGLRHRRLAAGAAAAPIFC